MNGKLKLSVCVRDHQNQVLEQNENSKETCGDRVGSVCHNSTCSDLCKQVTEMAPLQDGMSVFKNQNIDDHYVDVMMVKNGQNVTTVLHQLTDDNTKAVKHAEYLVGRGLTPSEVRIIQMVASGQTNQEIAKQLFISKATLKTHLNNAYKKLPAGMRPQSGRVS
ncbi:helix-turn-helix domain-containing protein [Bdellovibrio sp. GT3]|uniref:helix-turn-helix domain-containing protein n=1 Tax=Bdellovibrio sp. GT3 TaxID=3136282 RepID=UPI0030F1DD71